jgi:hypothetical protein
VGLEGGPADPCQEPPATTNFKNCPSVTIRKSSQ